MLHVPAADLDDIGIFLDQRQVLNPQGFGDNEQVEFVRHLPQDLQAFFAQSLKRMGRGAGLERASAHDVQAGLMDGPADSLRLGVTFH